MKYDIVIIGGGASGLCTAIMSKKDNNSILILEHSNRVGQKILSTGNGKCNLTNEECKVSLFEQNSENIYPYFSSGDISKVEDVIRKFDCDNTIKFFKGLGLLTENKNGYIYPRSEQASSVLDILRFRCDELGIDIVTNYQPKHVKKKDNLFDIDGKYFCDKLVLATGGMSAPKTGSDGSGYKIAKEFGHTIIKPLPALCGLKCNDKFVKELKGVRNDSLVTLKVKKGGNFENVLTAKGNLQFSDAGISGIPIFQISSLATKLIDEKKEILISIDLLPDIDKKELFSFLSNNQSNKLLGLINKKLANVIDKEVKNLHKDVDINADLGDFAKAYFSTITKFKMHPVSTFGFENSQVTSGGVSLDEICSNDLQSKIVDNLYFAGEVIDVNAICGGYNLQWAFSSANTVASKLIL